ncbi:unnamed protein product [Gadus morhua 'NCC']
MEDELLEFVLHCKAVVVVYGNKALLIRDCPHRTTLPGGAAVLAGVCCGGGGVLAGAGRDDEDVMTAPPG